MCRHSGGFSDTTTMFLSLLPLSLLATVVHALVNVTLDDTDPSIVYNGIWDPSSEHKSSLDFNGSHTFSSDASGSATLTFTGVAVYYLAPRWPYAVSTEIALDGGSGVVLNLTDPLASTTSPGGSESAQWSVIWSATNLSNTTHRVVVTMAAGGETIVVDGFIYTTENHSSSTSISPSTASAPAAQSSASPSVLPIRHQTHADALTIGLGIGLGMAALLCAGAAFYFLFYRRRSKGNRYRDRHQVIYESWGGDLDSDRSFGHPEDKHAVTPFLLGAPASPTRQTYIHAATASSAPSDAHPLLAPFDASGPYRDEPRIADSVVSTRISSEQPEPSATSGSDSRSSSSAAPSTRPGTAFESAVSNTPALSEKSRPPREQTATPGPPAYSA
uniref:Mid2 domain-containing protein n=1 Tax=Mycena chlorophos TaxID=658473 RepID=A0ABQ0MAV3_MYCCL|nr:predicted protein [Mycena chlorophos]